jgi:uracil-DNA glycosylase
VTLETLLAEVRGCQVCEGLPLGPRPVVQVGANARVVLIGQAPGTRVHASGVPWDDPSGDHLREWLGVDRATFYNPDRFAILPMGFCYPGKKKGGDAPPRPECAPLWHARLLGELPKERLLVLIGQYAQAHYLGPRRKRTLTETVRAWTDYLPGAIPLPHPSWRSKLWMKKNPWFADAVLPELRQRTAGT